MKNKKNPPKKNAPKNNYKPAPGEEGFLRISLINQGVMVRRKKTCPLGAVDIADITYKNLKLIDKFLSERGKIFSSRLTNVAVKKQRALATAVKQARNLALISPIAKPSKV